MIIDDYCTIDHGGETRNAHSSTERKQSITERNLKIYSEHQKQSNVIM